MAFSPGYRPGQLWLVGVSHRCGAVRPAAGQVRDSRGCERHSARESQAAKNQPHVEPCGNPRPGDPPWGPTWRMPPPQVRHILSSLSPCTRRSPAAATADTVGMKASSITRWLPAAMRIAPLLDPTLRTAPPRPRYALLINPFYPKDPHASFGKHVLTPSLALTSIAAATPPSWEVRYFDENLLQGPPPCEPFPQVVGITVHLTFASRAYELARWYRERGAKVILGGLHVLSCPEEAAPHADALALGEGVEIWPCILRDIEAGTFKAVYQGSYAKPYRDLPPPRRDILPKKSFLTTTSMIATRGCHNRCGFCELDSGDGACRMHGRVHRF